MKWRTKCEWQKFHRPPKCPVPKKKVFCDISLGCCTFFHAPSTFLISSPTQEKRWQSSRYSRMSFRSTKNYPPFLTFLHPLAKRLNSDWNPIKSILSFFCGYPFWAGQTLENSGSLYQFQEARDWRQEFLLRVIVTVIGGEGSSMGFFSPFQEWSKGRPQGICWQIRTPRYVP